MSRVSRARRTSGRPAVGESGGDVEEFDVAVVGAGVGGLFVASEIAKKWPKKSLCVFEATDSSGGRIASLQIPGVPLVAEMGAMRYLPKIHSKLASLVRDLGLRPRRFGFDQTAFFYLRGYCLPTETFRKSRIWSGRTPLPFRVSRSDHLTPFGLIEVSIRKALSKLSFVDVERSRSMARSVRELRQRLSAIGDGDPISLSRDQWDLIKAYGKIDGEFLSDTGFMDLVHRILEAEPYQLAYEGCGYESILTMWNAADAIPWFLADFSTDGYETIEGGMQRFTDALLAGLIRRKTAKVIQFQHVLRSLEADGDRVRLRFENGLGQAQRLIRATSVVLAIPQKALEQLELRGLRFQSSEADDDVRATARFRWVVSRLVTSNALLKLFLLYDKQWWATADSPDGTGSLRVVTDQPLRQIYHFGPDHEFPAPKSGPATPYRFVLAYSDSRSAEYWRQLNGDVGESEPYVRRDFRGRLDRNGRNALDRLLYKYGVAPRVVSRAQAQLARVHDMPEHDVPPPCVALMRHWADPPYHAGWHAWNTSWSSRDFADLMVKPFQNAEIYVCGEAFSSDQGWIEGALDTSTRVLEQLSAKLRA